MKRKPTSNVVSLADRYRAQGREDGQVAAVTYREQVEEMAAMGDLTRRERKAALGCSTARAWREAGVLETKVYNIPPLYREAYVKAFALHAARIDRKAYYRQIEVLR